MQTTVQNIYFFSINVQNSMCPQSIHKYICTGTINILNKGQENKSQF